MERVLKTLIARLVARGSAPALALLGWLRQSRSQKGRSRRDVAKPEGARSNARVDIPEVAAAHTQLTTDPVPPIQQIAGTEKSDFDENPNSQRLDSELPIADQESVEPVNVPETLLPSNGPSQSEVSESELEQTDAVATEPNGYGLGDGSREIPAPPSADAVTDHLIEKVESVDIPARSEIPSKSSLSPSPIENASSNAPHQAEHEASAIVSVDATRQKEIVHAHGDLDAKVGGKHEPDSDDSTHVAQSGGGPERGAAEIRANIVRPSVATSLSDTTVTEPLTTNIDAIADDFAKDAPASIEQPDTTGSRSSRAGKYRDRRGQRRAVSLPVADGSGPLQPEGTPLRKPAEAKLRLMLHKIRRVASLSAVLARPSDYPDQVSVVLGDCAEVNAYSEDRYDDVDLEWTPGLLAGELRVVSKEGYQWVRSNRRLHIFTEVAEEPGLVSVGSAAGNAPSVVICLRNDADEVRAAAASCGSPELVSLDHWSGIPDGWTILSGYRPTCAAEMGLASWLTALDPGVGTEILFSGGLRIRSSAFAEGRPPRIDITPLPPNAVVTIDGEMAKRGPDGAWSADGWDTPGDHLVDVVPGPSATYRILPDPWRKDGWETWDAHPDRFGKSQSAPWAVAQICGAAVSGPHGEYVVAAEAMPSIICIGLRRGMATLSTRTDAPVAVGLLSDPPAFLISSSGPRRRQGRITWLDPTSHSPVTRTIDRGWIEAVRSAASRRLPLVGAAAAAEDAWRGARERARRLRKRHS